MPSKLTPRLPLAERQHAARISVISAARQREAQSLLGDLSTPLSDGLANLEVRSRLEFCRFARAQGNGQAAMNAITAVQHLEGRQVSAGAMDEFGEVLWMQGEHALALQHLEEMMAATERLGKDAKHAGRMGILLGRKVS